MDNLDVSPGKFVELPVKRLFEILGALHDDGILEKACEKYRDDLFQRDANEIPTVDKFFNTNFGAVTTIPLHRVVEKVVEKIKANEVSAVVDSIGSGLLLFPAAKAKSFLDNIKTLQDEKSFDDFSTNITLPQSGIDIPGIGESILKQYKLDRPRVRFECGTCVIR